MNNISIQELELLFKLILQKLKKDQLTTFQFKVDGYWYVMSDEFTDLSINPEPAVGSLKDDIAFLKKAVKQQIIDSYSDLDRLAVILKLISEVQAPSN